VKGELLDDANSENLPRAGVMQDVEADKPSNQVTIAQLTSSDPPASVGNAASA
jgi:hypothetical protein